MAAGDVRAIRVFESACCFHDTANLLIDRMRKHREHQYHYPLCVNLAFAAELYFKTILYHDGVTVPQTHVLGRLFRKLNTRHQDSIKRLFDAEVKKKPYIPRIEAGNPEMRYDLARVLEANSNAFKEWRYIFEQRDYTVLFFGLEELCAAVRCYILNLEPRWVRKS